MIFHCKPSILEIPHLVDVVNLTLENYSELQVL